MMVHKQRGGTSLRIDRVFQGVGRIAQSSGTPHVGTFNRINAMLTSLSTIGRIDVLAAIRDRQHAPLTVLHFYERGQLEKLPSAETAVGLLPALWAFQQRHECGKSYRQDLGTSIRHVDAVAVKSSTVADLPKLLRTLKERMADRPVAFNRLRTHMMAFASDIQGEHSQFWLDIMRVKRFKRVEGRRVRPRKRRPLTVVELDAVCSAFADYPVLAGRRNSRQKTVRYVIRGADLAAMTRTLATTGMRPAEYWQRENASWEDRTSYVQVNGTKTPAAVRPTFRLDTPALPVCSEQFFRDRFAEATTKALRTELDAYSLRRTFAALCESAGLVESRRQAYLGHGPANTTAIYLQTHVLPFIPQDAAQVSEWITTERRRTRLTLVSVEHRA